MVLSLPHVLHLRHHLVVHEARRVMSRSLPVGYREGVGDLAPRCGITTNVEPSRSPKSWST